MTIKVAVIGVGYLGKIHAKKYAGNEQAELVAVVDVDHARASEIANEYQCRTETDYHWILRLEFPTWLKRRSIDGH